ncbi:hypothetical protein [Pseudomonas cichorii]|uniref:Uncharacterized protein n=1 Tax=Pseudomonas cichorii TaxID=36746 RepID=A0ABQ1DPS2_PSECI|nr:hypothetical protein [Pseudomonas cichorii]AHF68156.1 hypothetical protein PCH70_30030 [Pseudomonas cichorii JBC1]QVE15197.1 hypothetical protein KGD89_14910 [Pseudomonas cichorii]GFM92943.1 hypothetical protein PSCICP_29150 [Pseudomonas cichorii]SDO27200.1 hypothetical protein SAMN05216599_10782 [Pseudomonas cichorii]
MTLSNDKPIKAIGGDPLDILLSWLVKTPRTLGWDAIVAYNRGRINALLIQQYIKKLTADNYLTPIDGQIKGEGEKLKFFGIQLGMPRLSFENADIEHSTARVTQTITAGLAILQSEPAGGYKTIHSIMRPNGATGPTLWMDVDLLSAPGDVTQAGVVQIDLSKMTNFETDLFSDKASAIHAKEFFIERFKENPELQVYTLGTLDKSADSTLAPQHFVVRTQPAPGATNRAAPNYGDGAVVLLVTLKNGADGQTPTGNSDFKYLIPNDENGTKYSGTVLISNNVLFTKLITHHLNILLPGKTLTPKTSTDEQGKPGHIYLEYTQGAITKSDYKFVCNGYYSNYIVTASTPLITIPLAGATFTAYSDAIYFNWTNKTFPISMHYHNTRGDLSDTHSDETVNIKTNLSVALKLSIYPDTGVIHFEQEDVADEQIEIDMPKDHYAQNFNRYVDDLRNVIKDNLFEFTKNLALPDINTLLLRNLLFPDHNLMVLTDAYVPGDLTVFGNVTPSLTSFVIEPEHVVLKPEGNATFRVEPAATVTWSVKGLPGDNRSVGTINNQGVYIAPTTAQLEGRKPHQVIITAAGTTSRGIAASSSTLVSIVPQTITLNPVFSVVKPEGSIQFTAAIADDRPLQWTMRAPGQGGKLVPATGLSTTYTAAPLQVSGMFTLDVIEVTDTLGNLGEAYILVINRELGGQVDVDFAQAASGKAQLSFLKQYGADLTPVPPEKLTWTLLAGTGSVDASGLYTEPQYQVTGFALITCAFAREPDFEGAPIPVDYGYTAIALPLPQYSGKAMKYP